MTMYFFILWCYYGRRIKCRSNITKEDMALQKGGMKNGYCTDSCFHNLYTYVYPDCGRQD